MTMCALPQKRSARLYQVKKPTKQGYSNLRFASVRGHIVKQVNFWQKTAMLSNLGWLELTCRNWLRKKNWLCFDSYNLSLPIVIYKEHRQQNAIWCFFQQDRMFRVLWCQWNHVKRNHDSFKFKSFMFKANQIAFQSWIVVSTICLHNLSVLRSSITLD